MEYSQTCERTTTTIGTLNLWPLFSFMLLKLELGPKNGGRCRQVIVIRRWSSAQVWLYLKLRTKYFDKVILWTKNSACKPCHWLLKFYNVVAELYCKLIVSYHKKAGAVKPIKLKLGYISIIFFTVYC